MKKILLIITLIFTLFTGCSNNKSENNITSEKINSVSVETANEEVFSFAVSEINPTTTTNTTGYKTEFLETEIDYRNLILEDIVAPWREEDINIAISMSIFPEPYNRRFIDFDDDGIPELILTWTERNSGLLFIFKKIEDEIIQVPFNGDYDTTTPHSVFGIPPANEENWNDFVDPKNNKFIIGKSLNGNHYISGYSHNTNKDTCFIKQIIYENGEVNVKTIYRWGEFRWYYSNETDDYEYIFGYIKYLNGDQIEIPKNETGAYINRLDRAEYVEVQPEEIDDFLKQIYGENYQSPQ